MDARWKVTRGQYIGLRYQPVRSLRIEEGTRYIQNAADRFTIDGNFSQKIARLYYRNYLSVSLQNNKYAIAADKMAFNRSVLFTSTQNITIRRHMLYWNTSYNHVGNNTTGWVYYNSSLVTDVGFTYSLFGKVSASSAIGYNSIEGWYRQAGIKQNLSGQLGKRFMMTLYLDVRKNLHVERPVLQRLFRGD
ncbi:hypothetical protein [Paraflavitalea speifideaquila]|uniref:hypothetical protein n=1 Tax=Paraflavitalea speifideaquila TaxID=3076558 RepID=UPI0028E698CB|nr:hypothetical protein [Paraflavitalea speifideiaquila]